MHATRLANGGRVLVVGIIGLGLALASGALVRARAASGSPREAPAPPIAAVPEREPPPPPVEEDDDREPDTLAAQRLRLFERMQRDLGVSGDAIARVEAIFAASPVLGQGNPAISRHPMPRSECRRIRREAGLTPAHVAECGAPNMVPLFDTETGETEADAPVCIDQFEFPDIPC